ncbi:hypothetical protein [Nocardia otitidiscaviarum]|uniref:hypothetical protein n=1 Tax=Nocardia otitidiscaviarum TaxID=1823 RepID=UPI0024589D29|nr:hypothetical protein [Nocardia otitidiscaviarum]
MTARGRSRLRAWWGYRGRWRQRMRACHLTTGEGGVTAYPVALEVRLGDITDRVVVRMLPGQCPADWENRVDVLADVFGARDCRAWLVGPSRMELVFWHRIPGDGMEAAA